jgi:hypothetical protein
VPQKQSNSHRHFHNNKAVHQLACGTKGIGAAQHTPSCMFPAAAGREKFLRLNSVHDLDDA